MEMPRRGQKIVAGGASPRIGPCIEGAPDGAKAICLQPFSVAPPGRCAAFRPNPELAPGAIVFPPLWGLPPGRNEFHDRNQLTPEKRICRLSMWRLWLDGFRILET